MCAQGDKVSVTIRGNQIPVDRCIAPLVIAINEAGFKTTLSCCGHGFVPMAIALEDGRVLGAMSHAESRGIDSAYRQSIPPDLHCIHKV